MKLLIGDCLELMSQMKENSVDCIVTDPPYGLKFMGKQWDHNVPGRPFWEAMLRVAKPGAHLVAFGGTRTYHRLACVIEDAGWVLRDSLMWLFGSGMPKGQNISKALDKAAGAVRADVECAVTVAATEQARLFDGYGTALKPAYEPIVLAMKPTDGTFADNAKRWGVAGLNIDASRVSGSSRPKIEPHRNRGVGHTLSGGIDGSLYGSKQVGLTNEGRWPPNVLLSHALDCAPDQCADDCPVGMLDRQIGRRKSGKMRGGTRRANRRGWSGPMPETTAGETYVSRFFPRFRYASKVSRKERGADNQHPTVKPLAVMEWLVRLVAPPVIDGRRPVVLDPFMGSGTTGIAAQRLGLAFIGMDVMPEYVELARRRIDADRSAYSGGDEADSSTKSGSADSPTGRRATDEELAADVPETVPCKRSAWKA